jgi:hypothetical protein
MAREFKFPENRSLKSNPYPCDEEDFYKYKPDSFSNLAASFRKYKLE